MLLLISQSIHILTFKDVIETSFLVSWKKCRAGYIKFRRTIDGGLCEECRDKPGYIVHHKRALTPDNITDPDVSLSYSNLEFVCKDCHDQFDGHGVAKSLTQKIFFDAAGDPIPPVARGRGAG